jgi:predicted nucleic acid-binding protein
MFVLDTNVLSELRQPRKSNPRVATALVHGMTIVTRNVADFEATGVPVINPWE